MFIWFATQHTAVQPMTLAPWVWCQRKMAAVWLRSTQRFFFFFFLLFFVVVCVRVRRHLQTQLATQQQSSLLKQLGLVYLCSHWVWLITSWVTSLCWESGGGQTGGGVSVRGEGSYHSRTLLTPCADTYEFSSNKSDMASFPLASIFFPWFVDINIAGGRGGKCFSVWIRSSDWGKRGKQAMWKLFGMQSSHRWTRRAERGHRIC